MRAPYNAVLGRKVVPAELHLLLSCREARESCSDMADGHLELTGFYSHLRAQGKDIQLCLGSISSVCVCVCVLCVSAFLCVYMCMCV